MSISVDVGSRMLVEIRCEVELANRVLFLQPDVGNSFSLAFLTRQFLLKDDETRVVTADVVKIPVFLKNGQVCVFLTPPGPYFIIGPIDEQRLGMRIQPAEKASTLHSTDNERKSESTTLDDVLGYLLNNKYPDHLLDHTDPPETSVENRKRALRKRAQKYAVAYENDRPFLLKMDMSRDGAPQYRRVLLTSTEVRLSRTIGCLNHAVFSKLMDTCRYKTSFDAFIRKHILVETKLSDASTKSTTLSTAPFK